MAIDAKQLGDIVDRLVLHRQHARAEEILLQAYHQAKSEGDAQTIDSILAHLVFVHSSSDPPNVAQAERFCHEREKNQDTGYTKLQTATMLYYLAGDYPRAAAKLREAINKGNAEGDQPTVYSSLSLLGQALLELDRIAEVTEVLREIETMLPNKKPFVVGDETLLLESAHSRGIEKTLVRRIATALAPLCRDPEFKRRLEVLAAEHGSDGPTSA